MLPQSWNNCNFILRSAACMSLAPLLMSTPTSGYYR